MPGTPPFCKPPGPETSSRTRADGASPRPLPGPGGRGAGTGGPRKPWLPGRSPPRRPARTLAGTAPHSSCTLAGTTPLPSFPQTPASVIPAKTGVHLSSIFQGRLWIPAFAGMTRVGPSREWREWREKGPSREWRKRAAAVPHPRFPDPRRSVPWARGSLTRGACFDHALARGYAVPVRMRTSP